MIYGSVCSGIEAATVAWHPLGWQPAWFSEIEPFPCRLLQHYYPNVPNLGDMLKIQSNAHFQQSAIDLLVGGTPCQSFSMAGLRGGLADDRGNLALEFCRLLVVKRPRWFVWENVPGVFSSYSHEEGSSRVDGKGRTDGREFTETADFASILTGFQECGYSCSWRVLDAQFCGVPQRRRRVFVVGYLGNDWRPSAAVLFEPEGLRRNTPKGRKERKAVTGTIGKRTGGRSIGAEEAGSGLLVAGTIDANYGRLQGASGQDACHGHSTLVYDGAQITSKANRSNPSPGDPAPTLANGSRLWSIMPMNSCKDYKAREVLVSQPLTTNYGISNNGGSLLQTDERTVRRLTPLECERLQGFPDNYTAVPGAADSPRYESIGNSMAVPVMRWIGNRIDMVDKIFNLS